MNINITQILRPIRLAFLIEPNKKSSYLRAVRVCSSLWGGQFFPILPLYKRFSHEFRLEYRTHVSPIEFYFNSIENFDPDYIVVDKIYDIAYLSQIIGDRTIIQIDEIEESISDNNSKYGISIDDILLHLRDSEFKYIRNDSIRIVLPKVNERDLLSSTLFGSVSSTSLKRLKSQPFPKKYISFPKISQQTYPIFANEGAMHYLKICSYEIYNLGNPLWTSKTAVYILDPKRLTDLLIFWNLRALGWNLIAVPYDSYTSVYYRQAIISQQEEFHKRGSLSDHIYILKGNSISEETSAAIYTYVKSLNNNRETPVEYIHHWWIPRFWNDRKSLNYDRSASIIIRAKSEKHTSNIREQLIKVPVLYPEFGKKYTQHTKPRFVNELIYEMDDVEVKYAQVIPAISSKNLDMVVRGSGFNQWRFSENGIFFLASSSGEHLHFTIPKAKDVFGKWFEENGFKIKDSAVGKLSKQLLNNIGGVYGTNFFATPGILPILSLFENGRIVNRKALFAELSKNRKHFRLPQLKDVVERLIDKNIIQFGVELQCSICNQHSFYTLAEFQEIVKCTVCHQKFITPSHNPDDIIWSYRGIGPFSRNNKSEGIITVLLTLRFFRIALHPANITPLFSYEIYKDSKIVNEVDFAVFYKKFKTGFSKPDLFFCECKTEIDFAKKDIDRMQKLAETFPGSILVFATLKQQLSEVEINLISALARKFRKGLSERPINPILILTGNELLNWLTYDEKIKHLFVPHLQFSDEIGSLCDATTQHYLGIPAHSSEVQKRLNNKLKKTNSQLHQSQHSDD